MPSAIQCRDLRKTYDGKVEAVRGLSLDIQAGECFGLLGPNGAGKTTTIEILEGLLEPTSGQVSIFGHSWHENEREMREWLGISSKLDLEILQYPLIFRGIGHIELFTWIGHPMIEFFIALRVL